MTEPREIEGPESGSDDARASVLAPAEALFWDALEVEPEGRTAFLERESGGDEALVAEVEALLEADAAQVDDPGRSLTAFGLRLRDSALDEGFEERVNEDAVPPRLGPYCVVRPLGSGGFGSVFLAQAPDDERLVAVKLLRRGLDTDFIVGRFRREREILDGLEHRNVAALLDAGVSGDGRPFLVMEYVEGERVDAYCRSRDLSVTERLQLFCQIAGAVAHAHRSLVVHRDLKPANILVQPDGSPKLLDFGTAKLIASPTEHTATKTAAENRMLTPRYASPEQIQGGAVTTAIDVFSLGVLLYEVLTGSHPFTVEGDGRGDLLRRICEEDPPPDRSLHPDIAAILAKAMRKVPTERYGSVAEFEADVSRFLDSRPVLARRGTWRYRTSRFLRRYRLPLAVLGLLSAMALAFVVVLDQQRQEALRARERADVVSEYLRSLFLDLDPFRGSAEPVSVDELLDRGVQLLDRGEASRDPSLEQFLLATMAEINASLGRRQRAVELLQRAQELLPENDQERAGLEAQIGFHRLHLGEVEEGAAEIEAALTRLRSGADHLAYAEALSRRGTAYRMQGHYSRAADSLREALAILDRRGADARLLGETRLELALALQFLGKKNEALALAEEVETAWRQSDRISEAKRVEALEIQVIVLAETAEFSRAQKVSEEILEVRSRYLPSDHPVFLSSYYNLGALANMAGDSETAERFLRRTVTLMRASEGEQHPELPSALLWLGRILLDQGRGADARVEIRSAIEAGERAYGVIHEFVANAHQLHGEALWLASEADAALQALERSVEVFDELNAGRSDRSAKAHGLLMHALLDLGRFDDAAEVARCERLGATATDESTPEVIHDLFLVSAETRLEWLTAGGDPSVPFPWEGRKGLQATEEALRTAFVVERMARNGQTAEALRVGDRNVGSGPAWARVRLALASVWLNAASDVPEERAAARRYLEEAIETLPSFGDRPLLGGPSARELLAALDKEEKGR